MIEDYLSLASRIRRELDELWRVVNKAERAVEAVHRQPEERDLYVDSAVLSLHDFYSGLERIFQQIGTIIDGHIPSGAGWHRDLLEQMQADVENLRPPVLSKEAGQSLDEFLRFRHVVRNIYAFQFDPERVERLVTQMRSTMAKVQTELLTFALFLERVGGDSLPSGMLTCSS
ncbi:MAG: hypothetical protein AB1345_08905 [Chloroflexota bacterium]